MNPLRFPLRVAFCLAMIGFWLLPGRAQAYIDPGSGSLIWQILIAGLLSGLVLVKAYWQRIRALFTGRQPAQVEDEDRDDA